MKRDTRVEITPLRILVVDDDDASRRGLQRLLVGEGYDVVTAASSRQALGAAGGRHVDLLLTDVLLPEMGGDALARMLLETNPDLRVIFVSGGVGARPPGAAPFFEKPLDIDSLLDLLDQVRRGAPEQ